MIKIVSVLVLFCLNISNSLAKPPQFSANQRKELLAIYLQDARLEAMKERDLKRYSKRLASEFAEGNPIKYGFSFDSKTQIVKYHGLTAALEDFFIARYLQPWKSNKARNNQLTFEKFLQVYNRSLFGLERQARLIVRADECKSSNNDKVPQWVIYHESCRGTKYHKYSEHDKAVRIFSKANSNPQFADALEDIRKYLACGFDKFQAGSGNWVDDFVTNIYQKKAKRLKTKSVNKTYTSLICIYNLKHSKP